MKKRLLATTALTAALFIAAAPKEVHADPVSLTVLGSAMVSGIGTAITTGAMTAAFQAFVIAAATGFVSVALTPKAKKPRVQEGGFVQNNLGSALDHAIIYGETKVGGVVFYASTSNDETILHRMIAVAGHEIDSYVSFYLNDEELTIGSDGVCTAPERFAGNVYIETRLGTDDQTAVELYGFTKTVYDSELEEEVEQTVEVSLDEDSDAWTANHRARGIAYIYSALKFSQTAFPNGVPTLTAVVKGRKIYDPRTSTTAWSDNSALCIRDYLVSDFGLACDSDELNDTSFADAANDCDQSVNLAAGGTEKRYTTNGSFTTASTPNDVITQMLTAMGGMIWYSQGQFGVKAATWDAPTLSFDESDLIGPIEVTTRLSRRDQINEVRGTFRGAESNYQHTDFPSVSSNVFLAEDNNQKSALDLPLPFTSTSSRAQRIAKMVLYRQREQLRVNVKMGLAGFTARVGDIIQLTNTRMGWTNKAFEVNEWNFGLSEDFAFEVSMSLSEISEEVFEWNAEENLFLQNNTTLASPFSVPSVGLSISKELRKTPQSVVGVLVAEITSEQPTRVSHVELQYRPTNFTSSTNWRTASTGPLGAHQIPNLIDDIRYDYRARAFSVLGLYGDWTYVYNNNFDFDSLLPPENVTNFDRSIAGDTIVITWDAVTDLDALYYEIRHDTSTSGSETWASSNPIFKSIAHPTTSAAIGARSGTFFIKAVDRSGNYSTTASSFTVLASELPTLSATVTLTEDPDFDGNIDDNMAVVSNELLMDDYTASGSTGTYEFSDYINLGSSQNATVNYTLTETRKHANATAGEVYWDDISSSFTWDNWIGNFDTWTDEDVEWNDYSYTVYVRATSDDPTGASPTYGSWSPVTGGKVIGWGFQFKIEVVNLSENVTPAISALEATVGY